MSNCTDSGTGRSRTHTCSSNFTFTIIIQALLISSCLYYCNPFLLPTFFLLCTVTFLIWHLQSHLPLQPYYILGYCLMNTGVRSQSLLTDWSVMLVVLIWHQEGFRNLEKALCINEIRVQRWNIFLEGITGSQRKLS